MTVATTTRLAGAFIGTGANAALAFAFKCYDPTELVVTCGTSTLVYGSDYSVVLSTDQESNPGGTVNILAAANTLGASVYVRGNTVTKQSTDLPSQGRWSPKVVEAAFDRLVMILQEMRLLIDGDVSTLRMDLLAPGGASLVKLAAGVTYDPSSIGAALTPPGTAVADVAIAAGQLVNIYVTGGVTHMRLADASVQTKPANAFCPLAVAQGATGIWNRRGVIPGTSATTFAAALWLSDSVPGGFQSTAPTTVGHINQYVGLVLPGIGVEFSPQLEVYL